MKTDLHYYGTYCLARMAGLSRAAAAVIAFAAEYVDHSVVREVRNQKAGGMLVAEETAHHTTQVENILPVHQRYIWVPFHFLPGGQGESFYQQVACRKGSQSVIAREMLANHLRASRGDFGLQLIGITCHVLEDTYSHQGFSGLASPHNRLVDDSLEVLDASEATKEYLAGKKEGFLARFWRQCKECELYVEVMETLGGGAAEGLTAGLGHAAALTYPDLPYLHWEYAYEAGPLEGTRQERWNHQEFAEGCGHVHQFLSQVAEAHPEWADPGLAVAWDDNLAGNLSGMFQQQDGTAERSQMWRDAFSRGGLHPAVRGEAIPDYEQGAWERQRDSFPELERPAEVAALEAYRFYQAASFHKHYVLRELLPAHGMVVV